jgi:hypothetical protein
MSGPAYRPAAIGDAADIHALLLAVATEVPLAVETLEQEEALYAAVRKTLAWGESWVAEDGGRIVGCVLVDNIQTGRHWGENETLDLRYAAGEGLDALLGKLLERNAPITAIVRVANRNGLADQLEKLGFCETESRVGERRFRRDPGGAT